MEDYKYRPLDTNEASIRLIRLYNGDYGDRLNCTLFETVSTAKQGSMLDIPYEALSYTWGLPATLDGTQQLKEWKKKVHPPKESGSKGKEVDPDSRAQPQEIEYLNDDVRELPRLIPHGKKQSYIYIDNKRLAVTRNLYGAMQRLRYANRDRIFWIDAICIDQSNGNERNHQVAQMKRIYEHAEEVVIWLGAHLPQAEAAIELWSQYLATTATSGTEVSIKMYLESRQSWTGALADKVLHDLRRGFGSILLSKWFERVWIIQEVAFARTVTVVCGLTTISSIRLLKAINALDLPVNDYCQAILDVMPSRRRQESSWWQSDRSLWMILNKFRASKASITKDRIFALLGLTVDPDTITKQLVDYAQHDHLIVNDVMCYCFPEVARLKHAKLALPWSITSFLDELSNIPAIICWKTANISARADLEMPLRCRHHPPSMLPISYEEEFHLLSRRCLEAEKMPEDVSIRHIVTRIYSWHCHSILELMLTKAGDEVYWCDDSSRLELGTAQIIARIQKQIHGGLKVIETFGSSQWAYRLLVGAVILGSDPILMELLRNDNIVLELKNQEFHRLHYGGHWADTAFGAAVTRGRVGLAKHLIERGLVDIQRKDFSGLTPLAFAARNGLELELLVAPDAITSSDEM